MKWAEDNEIEGFAASSEWWRGLLRRNKKKAVKPNTNRTMLFAQYQILQQQWLRDELPHWRRLKMYDDDGELVRSRIWNADEVPIQFEPKNKSKQATSYDNKDVVLAKPDMSFDPAKRFATLIPFVCADGKPHDVYPFVIMRGSPSDRETKSYPMRVRWICNDNAWSKSGAWSEAMRHFGCRLNFRRREIPTNILYYDGYGTHKLEYPQSLLKGFGVEGRLLIPNSTHLMQPVDRHVGRTLQLGIMRKYGDLVSERSERKRKGVKLRRLQLGDMRIKLMKWVKSVWDEMKTNEALMKRCWENMPLNNRLQQRDLNSVIDDVRPSQGDDDEYVMEDFDDDREVDTVEEKQGEPQQNTTNTHNDSDSNNANPNNPNANTTTNDTTTANNNTTNNNNSNNTNPNNPNDDPITNATKQRKTKKKKSPKKKSRRKYKKSGLNKGWRDLFKM